MQTDFFQGGDGSSSRFEEEGQEETELNDGGQDGNSIGSGIMQVDDVIEVPDSDEEDLCRAHQELASHGVIDLSDEW